MSWVFGQEGANFVRTMLRLGRERASRPANFRLPCDRFTTSLGLPLPKWREDLLHCLSHASWA